MSGFKIDHISVIIKKRKYDQLFIAGFNKLCDSTYIVEV